MSRRVIQKSALHPKRWLEICLVVLMTTMAAVLWCSDAAFALCNSATSDCTGPQPIEPEPAPFTPPANGVFDWEMPSRFGQMVAITPPPVQGGNAIMDFHWQPDVYDFTGGAATVKSNGHYKDDYVNNVLYDQYVHPSELDVQFHGCYNQTDATLDQNGQATQYSYTWTIGTPTNDTTAPSFTSGPLHTCSNFTYRFKAQQYGSQLWDGLNVPVTLTITDSAGNAVTLPSGCATQTPGCQTIFVKDYLIVSIGDSYASGEGSPDIEGYWSESLFDPFDPLVWHPPVWEDTRCHRSASSGPAQAALAIEQKDPHSSVTFLSFACSGANVEEQDWDRNLGLNSGLTPPVLQTTFPYIRSNYNGVGVLGPYRGAEVPGQINLFNELTLSYDPGSGNYLDPQLKQVSDAVDNSKAGFASSSRTIDVLMVSGGGNDIGFSDIAKACLLVPDCASAAFFETALGTLPFPDLESYVTSQLYLLPFYYGDIAKQIPYYGLKIAQNSAGVPNIYVTQYGDAERDDHGNYCSELLDDVVPPLHIGASDVQWTGDTVYQSLIAAVQSGASNNGWHFVDGIKDDFESDPVNHKGHGYCASDPWVRRASEAANIEGPPLHGLGCPFVNPCPFENDPTSTKGTLHPTPRGYHVYAKHLVDAISCDLYPGSCPSSGPPPALPSFSTTAISSDGSVTAKQGAHGWLIGSCNGGSCSSSGAVYQVTATSTATITAGNIWINGVNSWAPVPGSSPTIINCDASGVTCQAGPSGTLLSWNFTFPNEGVYNLRLTAEDANNQTTSFQDEVKVDLHDPIASSQLSPASPNATGWYNVPVTVTLSGSDTSTGSGVDHLQYTLDGESPTVGGMGTQVAINTDGIHSIGYQAFDVAGRQSASQTVTVQLDQTPPTVTVSASPTSLWPPNKEMLPVTISGVITDRTSGVNPATAAYSVVDQYGTVQPSGPLTVGAGGSYSATISLEAFRNGTDLNGRTYTIKVTAQDNAGNSGSSSTSVIVPHNQPT